VVSAGDVAYRRLRRAQHDADLRGETDRMARELRDNLIGDVAWAALDPATVRRP
jgi:hypothetical protein